MANSGAGISSDAAQTSGDEYQVFLSFRGSDTHHGFTDFLYHGLMDAGVRVFKDDDEHLVDEDEHLVGEVISENLFHIMNSATLYIPIFSRTYAFSIRCLQELAFMVDHISKSEDWKSILPIFLDVEPEDVKLRTPLYRAAFEKHKEDFPKEVEAWRNALAAVDEIKGWNVEKDQSRATIVKLVVERVLEKLEINQKSVAERLVGLDDQVKDLIELLDVDDQAVRFIGIYGKGGIGKTTIAKVIFNELSSHFGKCCSFLENVRESLLTKEGIVQLQRKLLSDIVGSGSVEQLMDNEQAMRRIGDTLGTKKVLVVLDDVEKKEHIKKIIGGYSLHYGSRIIITTRNKILLNAKGLQAEILCYEMLKLDDALALQLFCQHAFNREFPPDDYQGLSSKIVSITGGLPLAIEVIGSLLNGKDEAFWKETLVKLREVPDEDIVEMLRISYDNLDRYQQQIFLDVACFLFNENKTEAIYMWADCQFYPIRGLKVLTDRSLIKILDNDKIWMHDQLIDLGRRIVRQESPFNLGKRSRLWTVQEGVEIMRTKKRKDDVQALKIYRSGDSIEITDEDFERLPNLRLLELNWGTYAGDFARCHSNLRWFSWHSPQDFRANNMYLEHLAVCKLDTIDFKDDSKAWDLIKRAQNLKVLSITQCSGITRIPNFSKCLRLERLTLAECFSLEKIEGFIGDLGSLIELKIEQCQGLRDLPEELGALVKLKRLSLSGCRGLRELPGSFGNLTSLIELNLRGTSIVKSPGMPLLRHAQEIPMDTSNLEFKLDKTEGLEEGPARQTGKESRSWGIRKMVFKLDLHDDKEKKKVLVIVSGFAGVDSFKIDMNDKKLTVFGDIDPVELTLKLRKLFFTEIVSVGPAKEGQKEEDNKKDDNKSNKKEEKADGNTNLEPSHFNIERKRSDDGYNWRKYGQKLVKGSENPRSYYKCTYPGCPTKKKVERSQDGHITEIVYKGTHNHPKSLSPRTLSSQSIEPPSSCITYLENVDQLDSVVRSESVQQDSSASLGDEESKVNSQMCKFAGDDDGIEPEAKRLKGNNVHERYSDSGDRIVREPRVVIQTTSGTDILDDGYYWRKYGQKGVIGRNYYKCRNTGCPARKHVQRASDDMRTLITTYDGKHNHDVLKKDSLPTGHLTWGREPLAPSSIRQGSPDRPNAWSGDPGPDVLSVSVRGISPKMASSEEKKNVIFTE